MAELKGLHQVEQQMKQNGSDIPPVDRWNPDFCGQIDMRIARDGRWFYNGSEIKREAMVKLFSRVLWKEGEDYFLKTPVEKVQIEVEDAPFQVVEMETVDEDGSQQLHFRTSTGDWVIAGECHPIIVRADPVTAEPSPYVVIRWGMYGRISRSVFYRMVEQAQLESVDGKDVLRLSSQGVSFTLGGVD